MKVLLLNGSSHPNGTTMAAIKEMEYTREKSRLHLPSSRENTALLIVPPIWKIRTEDREHTYRKCRLPNGKRAFAWHCGVSSG